jgi:multicomponent Na+:H+ antiporter subunit D
LTEDWQEAPDMSGASASAPTIAASRASSYFLIVPIAALALVTVGIGLAAEPVYLLASRAAEQLMNPPAYIQAVLGRRP